MNVKVEPRPEIQQDLLNLPTRELRMEAISYIVGIKDMPFRSLPLDVMPGSNLGDCRKIYFGEAEYRIVYRLLPNEKNPVTADVICVGPREGLEAYRTAVARLGR